jgi:hypothetical protein
MRKEADRRNSQRPKILGYHGILKASGGRVKVKSTVSNATERSRQVRTEKLSHRTDSKAVLGDMDQILV